MAEIPEPYEKLLHLMRTDASSETVAAEINVMLTRDQIASAERVAQTSKETADSLKRATWVLSLATIVLAVATVVLVVVTATSNT